MELSKDQREIVIHCLEIRKNLIETGIATYSANDAHVFNNSLISKNERNLRIEIRPLDRDQRELLTQLDAIIDMMK